MLLVLVVAVAFPGGVAHVVVPTSFGSCEYVFSSFVPHADAAEVGDAWCTRKEG